MEFADVYDTDDLYRRLIFLSDENKLDYDELYRFHLRYESDKTGYKGQKIADEMKERIKRLYSNDHNN